MRRALRSLRLRARRSLAGRSPTSAEPIALGRAAGALASVLLAVGIAFGVGIASARWTIGADASFAEVTVGPWRTAPLEGLPEADPYTKARYARSGAIPLGPAEGQSFTARTDSLDRPLTSRCAYRLVGPMPAARWWTLHVSPAPEGEGRPGALHSRGLLRDSEGSFTVTLSRAIAAGNWLALPAAGSRPITLDLVLYDTVVTRRSTLESRALPSIEPIGCEEARS